MKIKEIHILVALTSSCGRMIWVSPWKSLKTRNRPCLIHEKTQKEKHFFQEFSIPLLFKPKHMVTRYFLYLVTNVKALPSKVCTDTFLTSESNLNNLFKILPSHRQCANNQERQDFNLNINPCRAGILKLCNFLLGSIVQINTFRWAINLKFMWIQKKKPNYKRRTTLVP